MSFYPEGLGLVKCNFEQSRIDKSMNCCGDDDLFIISMLFHPHIFLFLIFKMSSTHRFEYNFTQEQFKKKTRFMILCVTAYEQLVRKNT